MRHRLAIKPTTNRFLIRPSRFLRHAPQGILWLTYFCNLTQQPGELFTDFLTHVNDAVVWRVDLGPTREILVKQLVWEWLNASTHNTLSAVHNEDIHQRS